ncbi:MAG: PepSY-associated TM helix domain-containing protein [Zymomonas mobilis]
MKIPSNLVRVYRDLHSWVGIVTSLFLFVAFYAGAVTMFEQPLQDWASQSISLPAPVSLHSTPELMAKAFAAHPEAKKNYTISLFPNAAHPERLSWSAPFGHGHGSHELTLAALDEKGALVTVQPHFSAAADFIDLLHQQVGIPLPHETALLVTGMVALLYAVALSSGVIIFLPKMAQNLFALRLTSSLRRMWLDIHNLLGIFSLPFHLVIALTSVVFAFHDPVYDVQQALLAKSPASINLSEKIKASSHSDKISRPDTANYPESSPLSPEEIVDHFGKQAPGFIVDSLSYMQNKEGRLILRIAGHDPRYRMRGSTSGFAEIDPYSGKIISSDYLPGHQSTSFAILTTFFALHFGNFGGLLVRWGYVLLGLGGAFLFYTGNQLWINSRKRREIKTGKILPSTRFLECLTAGCTNGCIAGISAVVCAAFLLPHGGSYKDVAAIYYSVFAFFVGLSFCLNAQHRNSILLLGAGLLTILIPVMASAYGHKSLFLSSNLSCSLIAWFFGALLLIAAIKQKNLPKKI